MIYVPRGFKADVIICNGKILCRWNVTYSVKIGVVEIGSYSRYCFYAIRNK